MNQYLKNEDGLANKVSGVIFDCDGVMVDSRKANVEFYNRVLKTFDLPPLTKEQESFTFMSTVVEALEYIIPIEHRASLAKVCSEDVNYIRDIMPLITLEEGLVDFLDFLLSNDIRCAVHTNRADSMEVVINMFNLHKYFDPIVTALMVKAKPAPDGIYYILDKWQIPVEQVIFVGDSQNDASASASANMFFVAYGKEKLEAQVKVQSYKSLTELFISK